MTAGNLLKTSQELGHRLKYLFFRLIKVAGAGILVSFTFWALMIFFAGNFCSGISNLYFWKCSKMLWFSIILLLVFPLLYLVWGFLYAQNLLLYLIVDWSVQKIKNHSVEWLYQKLPSSLHKLYQKIANILQIPYDSSQPKAFIESLLTIPQERLTEALKPSFIGFYIIMLLEFIFCIVWLKL